MARGTPDTTTTTTTTGVTFVLERGQRPDWFNSVKTLLLVLIPLKMILGVGLHIWFFVDQNAALTYYRIFESGFNEDLVRRRVLLSGMFFVIFDALEVVPIYYECCHLLCLVILWQIICCFAGMSGVFILTDFVLYIIVGFLYLMVALIVLMLIIVFTGKLHRIQTEEKQTRQRRANRTTP